MVVTAHFSRKTNSLGANGNGKSNLMDAICFALSYQDLHHLRVSKMSDILCTIGMKKENLAHVKLVFQGDGKEVIIAAKLFNGQSRRQFSLNGRTVSQKGL